MTGEEERVRILRSAIPNRTDSGSGASNDLLPLGHTKVYGHRAHAPSCEPFKTPCVVLFTIAARESP